VVALSNLTQLVGVVVAHLLNQHQLLGLVVGVVHGLVVHNVLVGEVHD
jgi:hypothetical protein